MKDCLLKKGMICWEVLIGKLMSKTVDVAVDAVIEQGENKEIIDIEWPHSFKKICFNMSKTRPLFVYFRHFHSTAIINL